MEIEMIILMHNYTLVGRPSDDNETTTKKKRNVDDFREDMRGNIKLFHMHNNIEANKKGNRQRVERKTSNTFGFKPLDCLSSSFGGKE